MVRPRLIKQGISVLSLIGLVLFIAGCSGKGSETSVLERGKYLAMVGGCGDCHSPKTITSAGPVPDAKRLLSGYPASARLPEIPKGILGPAQWGAITNTDMTAWAGPWGVSFSYNLSSHAPTGIGAWNESLFIQSLRSGKFMGTSRDMLPPMPWQTIGQMTDDDLKAIFAYLKSVPPIENVIPDPIPPSQ
jgi:hypothetical protein